MSVVKRGNSQYWYIQFQLSGKTYIRSSRTGNKKLAEQMEVEWKAKLHAQHYLGKRERLPLGDALRLFIATKQGTANHRNLRGHQDAIERHLNPRKYLDELNNHDLERLKRDREAEGIAAQTLKHCFNLINAAAKHARKLGYATTELDLPHVKLPKYRLRFLSDD